MNVNETEKIAFHFIEMAKDKMGDRLSDFTIVELYDIPAHRDFSIDFVAYNYLFVRLSYSNGSFGCSIVSGKYRTYLKNSQKRWDNTNFDVFFKELKRELELRIPDEYLKAKGWL